MINVRSASEQEEYSLYCIVEGDTFTMPLAREEYVLDVTTELLRNNQVSQKNKYSAFQFILNNIS